MSLQEIEDTKTYPIVKCICDAGTERENFFVSLNNLQFKPDFVRVDAISTIFDTPQKAMFSLWCDLVGSPIAIFSGQDQTYHPNTLIRMSKDAQQINFQISEGNTTSDGYNGLSAPTINDTAYLGITLTFIKLKKYNSNQSVYVPDVSRRVN